MTIFPTHSYIYKFIPQSKKEYAFQQHQAEQSQL